MRYELFIRLDKQLHYQYNQKYQNLLNIMKHEVQAHIVKNKGKTNFCNPSDRGAGCCCVESIISVDERGQMVLPKELRKKANIKAGDRFAVTSWEKNGEVCCITLTKVEELAEMVKNRLTPVMKDIL